MKYKEGDKVRIKSLDWYNENKDEYDYIVLGKHMFRPLMSKYCGEVCTIDNVHSDFYIMNNNDCKWTDEMIEGLVEEGGKETSWKPSKEEMDVLYGLAYITNKYDEHKEEVITRLYQDLKREFFNGSSYENMFPNTENDVRRRSTIQVLEYARSLDNYNQYGKADIDKNIAWLENMKVSMTQEGTYLYKLSHPEDDHLPEGGKRVFIHDGRIDGDGYGVMLGFTSEEELCKSSGFGNFCYGGDVRLATDEEIELFIKEVCYYPKSIKIY